jgi:hypothetical protein
VRCGGCCGGAVLLRRGHGEQRSAQRGEAAGDGGGCGLSEPNLQALHALCSERDRVLGNIVEYYTAWSARRRYGELTRRQSRMHERVFIRRQGA